MVTIDDYGRPEPEPAVGEVQVSMDESKQVRTGGEVTACIQRTVEI